MNNQNVKGFVYYSLIIALFLTISGCSSPTPSHSFRIADGNFLYDEKPIQIRSGEMHYPRIPEEYWDNRIITAKAMGLNTIAVYCFWNFHETSPGVWDFSSERHNVAKFIKLCQANDMHVILRPGPYVCAEWEFGGYPWWLLNNQDIKIRNNQAFLDSCTIYIDKLANELRDLQITHGGPIIMIQAENEFGSYMAQRKDIPRDEHLNYYHGITQLLKNAGFDVPMFTSDGDWLFEDGAIPGVLPAANGETNIANLKKTVDKYYPGGPYFVAEYYPGWLDHWGEEFVKVDSKNVAAQIDTFMKYDVSFSIYMVHGGTNFGFSSGANYNSEHDIQPDITSYDYDAPINEYGMPTQKYLDIKKVISKYETVPSSTTSWKSLKKLPDVQLRVVSNLLDLTDDVPVKKSDAPLSFEQLNQGHGYVIYKRYFEDAIHGVLHIKGLRDYALVFVNQKRVGELNRMNKIYEMVIDIPAGAELDILVENMGRINYGAEIPNNQKGIISPIYIDSTEIKGNWEMYLFPFDKVPGSKGQNIASVDSLPVIYSGSFELKENNSDYMLDMSLWGKGIVFVNGYHLGRYWSIGPQQTLYLPGCWLREGTNEVVIVEMTNDRLHTTLEFSDKAILDELKL